jgi:hypothetical protein
MTKAEIRREEIYRTNVIAQKTINFINHQISKGFSQKQIRNGIKLANSNRLGA